MSTLAVFTHGLVLSFSLIVAIGAQNAFVLRQGLRREHVGGVVAFCALADIVLIAVGVFGMAELLGERPALVRWLTWFGAGFLALYGLRALHRATQWQMLQPASGDHRSRWIATMAQVAAFTFLNPHVYLDTVLLVGGIGARQPAELHAWFVAGASTASLGWFGALGYGARRLAPLFARPTAWRVLDGLIGIVMLALAALLVQSISGFTPI